MTRPAVLLLALLAGASHASAQAPTRLTQARPTKATAPVEVELASSGTGPTVELRITSRPRVDAASLSVAVEVEDGLSLTGPAEWRGPAHLGEDVSRAIAARVTGPGEQRVIVTATIGFADGSTQSAVQVFALNPAPAVHGFARISSPDVVRGPDGRSVVEVMTGRP